MRIDIAFNLAYFCVWFVYWRVAISVVETRLHRMIQWYFVSSCSQNFLFLSMETMLSMFYIASLISINSANPSKNSPIFKWNTNVVTIAPVDVLTRQGISSLNGDPALRRFDVIVALLSRCVPAGAISRLRSELYRDLMYHCCICLCVSINLFWIWIWIECIASSVIYD